MEIGVGLTMHRPRRARFSVVLVCIVWIFTPGTVSSTPQQSRGFDRLVDDAKKASEGNRLDEAATLYRKALTLRPRWIEGWWALGTLEYEQDRYGKAALAFQKLIALDSKNGTAHAMLGLCQFQLRQDSPALKNLLAAEQLGVLKNAQLRNVALYHLALLQLRAGKYGAARESFAHLARDGVRSKDLTKGLGLAALLIKHQDSPADGTPGATVVERAGEAELLLTANDFDQAKQKYALLTTEFPDYPNLHFAFGRLLLETHDNDHAVREFELELKRDPKHVNAMLEIAVARQQAAPQEGLKYAEEAARLAPRLPFAHYILGMLRLDSGDAAAAIPELETAQKAFPNEAGVYFALGRAYARVGRKAEASKARAEFARLNAQSAKPSGPTIYGSETKTLDKERP